MSNPEQATREAVAQMSLGQAFRLYAASLGALVLCVFGAARLDSEALWLLAFLGYFTAGVYLNRTVLRGLIEWHPMYSTLENVTNDKLRMFFLWPLAYLNLFFRLWVDKAI